MNYSNVREKKLNVSLNGYMDLCDYLIFRNAEKLAEWLKKTGDSMCYGTKAGLTIMPGILLRDSAEGALALMARNTERGRPDSYYRTPKTTSERYSDSAKFIAGAASIVLAGFAAVATGGLGALAAVAGFTSFTTLATAVVTVGAYAAGAYVIGMAAYSPLVSLCAVAGAALKGGIPGFAVAIPTALANFSTGRARAQEAKDQKQVDAGKDRAVLEGERKADQAMHLIRQMPEPVRDMLIFNLGRQFKDAFEKASADIVTVKVAVKGKSLKKDL